MYELLNIEIKDGKQLVSARELHSFLEIKTEFRHWFPRMCEYGFVDGVDYTPVIFEHPLNKQPTTDYAMTLDMAKEVSMVQRNEKGKVARQYFIKCEKLTRELARYYDEKLAMIVDRLDRTERLVGLKCKQKFDYGRYIKNKMCITKANKAYENVKMVLFAELGVSKWEEISYSLDVIMKIDEVLEVLKLDRQLSL